MGDITPRAAYLKNQLAKARRELEHLRKRANLLEHENNRLRGVIDAYVRLFERYAADGTWFDSEDWLSLSNEMLMERDGVE